MDIVGWVLFVVAILVAIGCLIAMSNLPRDFQQDYAKYTLMGAIPVAVFGLFLPGGPTTGGFYIRAIVDILVFVSCLAIMQTIEDGRMQRKNRER